MNYCAVVKYPLDADVPARIKALAEGLQSCAIELVDLGVELAEVDELLDRARDAAEWELDAIGGEPRPLEQA